MSDIRQTARKAQHSDGIDHAVRLGLVAYGVVHLLIAWLALQLAFGEKSQSASNTGAMQTLAQQPLGAVMLWVVAVGMLMLVLWRLLEAWQHFETEDGKDAVLKPVAYVMKAVLYGALGATAIQVAVGSSSGGGTDGITAQLMQLPGGQLIVGAVGLGVLGYGAGYVYRGWAEKFLDKLDAEGRSGETGRAYRLLGKIGHIAKGVAVGVIGALFLYAAVTQDPKKSGGLDQALQEISEQPFGQALLVAVALGIGCYGVFCFARARHLSR